MSDEQQGASLHFCTEHRQGRLLWQKLQLAKGVRPFGFPRGAMSNEPPQNDRDGFRTERMRGYRKRYWDRFAETRRRIYGSVTNAEYEEIERRAKEADRSVWTQLHAEARAYARGEYLPSNDVAGLVTDLVVQLRRIGNNLNQITREMYRRDDIDAAELGSVVAELEAEIRSFVSRPWGELESGGSNDDMDDAGGT